MEQLSRASLFKTIEVVAVKRTACRSPSTCSRVSDFDSMRSHDNTRGLAAAIGRALIRSRDRGLMSEIDGDINAFCTREPSSLPRAYVRERFANSIDFSPIVSVGGRVFTLSESFPRRRYSGSEPEHSNFRIDVSLAARMGEERMCKSRRRESHRHKDSYRSGNVEDEHEEAVPLSLSLALSPHPPLLHPRALGE